MRDRTVDAFCASGFEVHEISEVEQKATVFGTECGGDRRLAGRDRVKANDARGALL